MLTLANVLHLVQLVLMTMSVMNFVMGFAAAFADQDIELAKYHMYWGGVTAGISLVVGLTAYGFVHS